MASSGFIGVGVKRKREESDDHDDCIPISKRINSLHIENQSRGLCQQNYDSSEINGTEQFCRAGPSHDDMVHSERLSTIVENNNHCLSAMDGASHIRNSFNQSYLSHMDGGTSHQSSSSNTSQAVSHPGNMSISNMGHLPNQIASHMNHQHYECTNQNVILSQDISSKVDVPVNGVHSCMSMDHLMQRQQSAESFDCEQMPAGPYQPELGMSENPHYYTVNQTLYEAHLAKVRRM